MKTITETELKNILAEHKLWLNSKGGKRANLYGVNLKGANLAGASLTAAILTRANLEEANLFEANLAGANLTLANLKGANLEGANLKGANLTGTILKKRKETSSASPSFSEELSKLLDKHGMKLASPITVLPK